MTGHTRRFLQQFLADHPIKGKVLDVGSYNVNGTVRDICEENGLVFSGLDMRGGGGIDYVMNAHDIKEKLQEESFDLVVCFDTLEHDNKFWISVENMRWVLKKGGWLVMKAPSINCEKHEHPSDYYRFLQGAFELFFEGYEDCCIKTVIGDGNSQKPDCITGFGRKP